MHKDEKSQLGTMVRVIVIIHSETNWVQQQIWQFDCSDAGSLLVRRVRE